MDRYWIVGCLALAVSYASSLFAVGFLPSRFPLITSLSGRYGSIDGFRGLLALTVLGHHFAIHLQINQESSNAIIPISFFNSIGPTAVVIFFMITAILFYRRLLDLKGVVNTRKFFIARVFRLSPAFFTAFFVALIIGLFTNNLHGTQSYAQSLLSLVNWFTFLLFNGYTLVFGIDMKQQLGMVWSLRYEWAFYLSFPILLLIYRLMQPSRNQRIVAIIVLVIICFAYDNLQFMGFRLVIASAFLWGMLVVEVASFRKVQNLMKLYLVGAFSTVVLVVSLLNTSLIYSPVQYFICSLVLLCIYSNNSFFYLFTSRRCVILGDGSYGIYLFHLMIMHLIIYFANSFHVEVTHTWIWIVLIISSIVVSVLSSVFYYLIELPIINLGKGICRYISDVRNPELKPFSSGNADF